MALNVSDQMTREVTDEQTDPVLTVAGDGSPDRDVDGRDAPAPRAADVVAVEGEVEARQGAKDAVVIARVFREGEAPRDVGVEDLPELVAVDANFAWVDLAAYTEGDLRELAGALRLHPVAVRAALSPWRRPRLDVFADHFLVTATVARVDADTRRVHAHQLDLFVGRNYLLSVHKLLLPFGERVAARAAQSPELVRLDSAFMLFILLDQLLEYYDGLTERLEDEIEEMEERALRDAADPFLEDLLRLKRFVFALGRLVDQHREVFNAFLRPDFAPISGDEVEPYFRDLEARLERLLDRMSAARDSVNGAFDIYVSHVAHRTNHVMQILTIVSTVLLPATVLIGIFGTSIEGVPLYRPIWFWVMMAVMALVSGGILYAFRRRGWI